MQSGAANTGDAEANPVSMGHDVNGIGNEVGLHKTHAEHGHDLELLPGRHLQFSKRGQRKAQDNQVESNLHAAANEAE